MFDSCRYTWLLLLAIKLRLIDGKLKVVKVLTNAGHLISRWLAELLLLLVWIFKQDRLVLSSLSLKLLLMANNSSKRCSVDLVRTCLIVSSTCSRLYLIILLCSHAYMLSFVQIVGQVFNLPLIHG